MSCQPSTEGREPRRLFCVLSATTLSCYLGPEEPDAEARPALRLPVNKDTRIRVMEKQSGGEKFQSLSIINPSPEGTRSQVFTADTPQQLDRWQEALHQHLYDQSRWLHCCERPVTIEAASPRKPSLFLTKPADSVYNDLSINSPGKCESVTDIIRSKIQESNGRFLIGDREGGEPPNWAALFDGSRSFEWRRKTATAVLSRSPTRSSCSSPEPCSGAAPDGGKKRRAPLPPTGPAVPPPAHVPRPERPPRPPPLSHPQKENTLRAKSKTGRRSLDAKFSAIVQQLQHNAKYGGGLPAAARKNAPLGVDGVATPRSRLRELSRERSRLKASLES